MSRLECEHPTLESACADCLIEARAKLQAAKAENQELIKDYAEWMSPEDYVPLAQERDALRAEVARLREALENLLADSIERHRARCAEYAEYFHLTDAEADATAALEVKP